jgi:hypothetical protein
MSRVFKRSADTIFSVVDNDVLALRIENGRCYGMEEVAAAVWSLLERPRGLDSICEQLLEQYEVEAATCRSDVVELLELLRSEGLVD